ncbi:class I SAM-dependent methyltransferase [Thalassobacillus hwangdonensis]|uniref:Class I SAM-dependent methyltransferase n=1 Tax=Thalassobacillus hwangdonensis TaxID=546108 RepID=A0ABW3L0T3_9BACI
MNTIDHNKKAWDKKVEEGAVYTKPVSKEMIETSKSGDWSITVTTEKPVPRNWFPSSLDGLKVLCLAAGGGQQGPVLAAAGAEVTVIDISIKQLEQDAFVAERDGLNLKTVQGSMDDLHMFEDESFDLIVHPVSNLFVEYIQPVWNEAARVLKEKGTLISGFTNPLLFIFNDEQEMKGNLEVSNSVPSSTVSGFSEEELQAYLEADQTIEYAHTLEEQIQGQINAGFMVAGLYEDDFGGRRMLDKYIKTFIATKAIKQS